MLSQVNRKKFDSILESIIDQEVNTNRLLNQWKTKKADLFQLFNNKLSISRDIDEFISDVEIADELNNFVCDIKKIEKSYNINYNNVVEFLENMVTLEEIKQNKIIINRTEQYPNCKIGIKLSKLLGSIITDSSKIEVYKRNGFKEYSAKEYFDIQYSMFNQSLKFKGEIVLSIDPIDYITMSISDTWQSCHNIAEGCYKAGTLSYMCDKVTVIAYVKGKEIDFQNNIVNDKNWRMCVFIDIHSKTAIFSRQYPNKNEVLYNKVRDIVITELFNANNNYITETNDYNTICDYINDNSDLHYNDILSYHYKGSMITATNYYTVLYIGSKPYCPICGYNKLDESDSITCADCRKDGIPCNHCGEYHNEEEIEYINGYAYCYDCINELYEICSHCGEYIERDDAISGPDGVYCDYCASKHLFCCEECGEYDYKCNKIHIEDVNIDICEYCANNNYTQCNECGEYFENTEEYNSNNYCEECYYSILEEEKEVI